MYPPLSVAASKEALYFATTGQVVKFKNETFEVVAGLGNTNIGFSGENRDPTLAKIYSPYQIVLQNETIFIADTNNFVIRKIAPLCENYTQYSQIESKTTVNNTNELLLSLRNSRQCTSFSHSNGFDLDNLPLVELRYKTSGIEYKTLVSDWNRDMSHSTDISGRLLDILSISLINNESVEYGMIPTAAVNNFVFVGNIISATIIDYYTVTPDSVLSFTMQLQFHNTKTNQMEKSQIVSSSRGNTITGLQHNTLYLVRVKSKVVYRNGIELESLETVIPLQTQLGIAPSGNVQQIQLSTENQQFLISWKSGVPMSLQGNVPIDRMEILMIQQTQQPLQEQQEEQNSTHLVVPYDALTNSPSYYFISLFQYNMEYTFSMRVCNPIGCSNYSTLGTASIAQPSDPSTTTPTTPTANLVIPIVVPITVVLLLLFSLLLLLLLCCGICALISVKVAKQKKSSSTKQQQQQQELQEMVSKEFRIDESKLDFTNSVNVGSGASGSVFTAKYFNIDVAVKMVKKTNMGIETDMSDFYNELRFLNSNAQHQNIIRFFGVFESEEKNTLGLVMEYCSNGSVANYISRHEIGFSQKLSFIKGIANGMQYLHFHNIAHRDLKCENVLLDSELQPKIIDFGYSREIQEEANKSLNLTMNVGTAVYCAPEVLKQQVSMEQSNTAVPNGTNSNENASIHSTTSQKKLAYDKRCDVYSFAICIFVIYFQNKNPYGNHVTDNQIMFQLLQNVDFRPKFNESLVPTNEKWIIELMKQCWKSNPEERPSFEQICNILQSNNDQ